MRANHFTMKKTFFTLISALITSISSGQTIDKVSDISIQPIEHATFALNWQGKTLLFDPSVDQEKLKNVGKPDFVFITDIHGDHLNVSTLANLDLSQAILIAPKAVADQLPQQYQEKIHILQNGEKTTLGDIQVEAIPMYNLTEEKKTMHTKGRGNGYVLTLGDKRVYVSGDTEDIPEMRALKNIDIAFVCMNLPYTMSINQAADAVLAFKPKIVYPYHYRGQGGKSDIQAFKTLVQQGDKSIQVVLKDWYGGQ